MPVVRGVWPARGCEMVCPREGCNCHGAISSAVTVRNSPKQNILVDAAEDRKTYLTSGCPTCCFSATLFLQPECFPCSATSSPPANSRGTPTD